MKYANEDATHNSMIKSQLYLKKASAILTLGEKEFAVNDTIKSNRHVHSCTQPFLPSPHRLWTFIFLRLQIRAGGEGQGIHPQKRCPHTGFLRLCK
jgi:hypothetical protein